MGSLEQKLERAEKVAHISSKHVGLTIALIGVLIAICAARVSSEQNELTRTMTEQTQAHSDYSGASGKFRSVMIELEKLRYESSPESTEAGPLTELERFLRLSLDYSQERDFAKRWDDTYQPAVEAHFDAAEGYHNAQLVAEIGLVVASIAVLLSSQARVGSLDSSCRDFYWRAHSDFHKNAPFCFARTREHSTSGRCLSTAPRSPPRCERRRTNLRRTRSRGKNPC